MKKYFITGLLIWIPLGITLWVLSVLFGIMNQTLNLVPPQLRAEHPVLFNLPFTGALVALLIVFCTGVLTANILGQRLILLWEAILARIPVVNSIYNGVKQVSDTVLSPSGQAFRKALLVRYPHSGTWTIALLTGQPGGEVADKLGEGYLSVYVPTTPNPTSGFFLIVPRADVIELELSVDEALKYIISMGVVVPVRKPARPPAESTV